MVNVYIAEKNAEALFKSEPNSEIIQKLRQNKRRKVKMKNGFVLINYYLNTKDEFKELLIEADSAILNGYNFKTGELNPLGVTLQIAYDFLYGYRNFPEENIVEVLEVYE